jgi:hypothetical protein
MYHLTDEDKLLVASILWAVLMIGPLIFFCLNKNASLKRKIFRPIVIGAGLLYL